MLHAYSSHPHPALGIHVIRRGFARAPCEHSFNVILHARDWPNMSMVEKQRKKDLLSFKMKPFFLDATGGTQGS